MKSKDFIPGSNVEFNDFQENLVKKINEYLAGWGLSTDAITELATLTSGPNNKKKRWEDAWSIVKTKNFTKAEEAEMLKARKEYESGHKEIPTDTSLRLFITRYIRNNPKVTIQQKVEMGITQPDEEITPTSPGLAKSAGAGLFGKVMNAQHLLQNSEVTVPGQKSKAKGEGVEEIQVFIAFTDATVTAHPDLKEFAYDGTVTRGKYKRNFDPSQVGKKAWYYARVMIKGKTKTYGPPSEYWNAVVM
jgi:hypothetical protein